MSAMQIVVNASPLILLCNAELEFILPALWTEIIIPEAVWEEVMAGSDLATRKLSTLAWLRKTYVSPIPEIVQWDLGTGETEVLSLVMGRGDGYTAVLDDLQAKKCAKALSLPAIGTGAVLITAKEQGVIASVGESLYKLREVGLWITNPVITMLLSQAGEA